MTFLQDIKKLRLSSSDEDKELDGTEVKDPISHDRNDTVVIHDLNNTMSSFDPRKSTTNTNERTSVSTRRKKKRRKKKPKEKSNSKNNINNEINIENNNNELDNININESTNTTNNITLENSSINEKNKKLKYRNSENRITDNQLQFLSDPVPINSNLFDFSRKPARLLWTYLFSFLASVDIMVNIPTLYEATQEAAPHNSNFYVYIFSAYIVCQIVGSAIVAYWMDKRQITEILLFCSLLLGLGNMLYAHAVGKKQSVLMVISRGICGLGSSILITGFAHVTRYSEERVNREERIIYFQFIISLGTIFGPLIGVFVSSGSVDMGFWEINKNNSGAFIVFIVSSLYFVVLFIWMIIDYYKKRKKQQLGVILSHREDSYESNENNYDPDNTNINVLRQNIFEWSPHEFCSYSAFILWFVYSVTVFTFWSFEAAIIPVGSDSDANYNWNNRQLYSVFFFIGILYCLAFSLNKFILNILNIIFEKRIVTSLLIMIIGCFLLTPFGSDNSKNSEIKTWQVIASCPFLTFGYCIATIQCPVLYCRLMGIKLNDLGISMSWFFALASIPKLFGPIFGYLIIHHFNSVNFISHFNGILLCITSVIAFLNLQFKSNNINPKLSLSANLGIKDDNLHTGLLRVTDRL